MDNNSEGAGLDWSADRILPAFQAPEHLDVFDLRTASREVQLSVATLVGLINRPRPQVYLISRNNDAFWLQEIFASIPYDISPLAANEILIALLSSHRDRVQGTIIYDPDFSDSINIATMLAGQQDGIIVSPVQASELQQPPYALPVLADLRTYGWGSRLEAYRWAQQNLLGHASSQLIAGLDPQIALGIRPFLVATRTFIYWLNPLNVLPNPSVGWLSERGLLKQLLHSFSPGVAHLGWFIHEGSGVSMTSEAALPVFASDLFSNLEVWTSFQPQLQPQGFTDAQELKRAPQASLRVPTPALSKIYLSFTFSEGDNWQYIQEHMLRLWQDPARGSLPLGWTTSPALLQAAPAMAAYYARTATEQDEFVAGPSGAGYMYPSRWPGEHLPVFLQRTGQWMQQMNLKVLEVLDSNFWQNLSLMLRAIFAGTGMALIKRDLQERFAETLSFFGIHGLLSGAGQEKASWVIISDIPVYQNLGLASSIDGTLAMIKRATSANQQRPYFLSVYVLAWRMTPSDLKHIVQQLGSEYEVVTPARLLTLVGKATSSFPCGHVHSQRDIT